MGKQHAEAFLDSFAALLGSIENVYVNEGKPVPTDPWVILAEVFRGARNTSSDLKIPESAQPRTIG